MSGAIRRVVVVGGGTLAWIAATGLRRALPHLDLEVSVLDDGPERGAPAGRWTLPSQRGVHAQLGIPEVDFARATGATFKLATELVGWQGEGTRFLHAHGDIGAPVEGSPFYKYLIARGLAGQRVAADGFSVAALAVQLGRFARPMGRDTDLTASFTYGFHLDERAYAAYLRAHAEKSGVRRVEGVLADVQRAADGRVAALRLANGATLEANYFIDCSGRESRLFGRLDDAPRVDWSSWLPCDRMLSALAAPAADIPPATRIAAAEAGWTFHAPLVDASLTGSVYASRFTSDEHALAMLRKSAELRGEPVLTPIHAGRRASFWRHNCVALGAATVELEPLAGAELHFAQLGLALFLELFPLDAGGEVEAVEYNRLMAEHADSLRDFTIAHYRVSRRTGAFWDTVRAAAPPVTLANKLNLYSSTGRIDLRDHETFEEVDWAWLLLGSGTFPDALEWQIQQRFDQLSAAEVGSLAQHVAGLASSMPRHADVLQWLRSPATHAGS